LAQNDKIGFIGVPWTAIPSVRPGSMGIMFDKVSRTLPPHLKAVVVSGAYGADPDSEADGILYHRLSDRKDRLFCKPIGAIHRLVTGLSWDYHFRTYFHRDYINKAASFLSEQNVDSILFPLYPQWGPILRSANPDARLVLWMQCEWLSAGPAYYEKCLDSIDRIVCCSEYIADKIAARYPSTKEKLRTLPNGVDSNLFSPSNNRGRRQILYAGRLTPEKGAHVLLKAFEQIKLKYPDAQLILAGPFWITPTSQLIGADKNDIRRWRKLGKSYKSWIGKEAHRLSSVFLTDHVPHKALVRIYRTASVFVHPALWNEPFGMILAEAMACGLPVVASNCGGVPEVVQDGRSGLLTEPGDVSGLTMAIERLFENKEFATRLGSAARSRAEELFEWKSLSARMAEIALD